jgi:hypothetical protein
MLEQKLRQLETEFDRGQEQMALLDQKRADLRDTLLRISGAIQVLKELGAENGAGPQDAAIDRALELGT